MKSQPVIVLLSSIILGQTLGGCDKPVLDQAAPPSATVQTKDDEVRKRIERISDLLSKAALENDFETQLKYFTEDAIINPPLGPEVRGKAEIEGASRRVAKSVMRFTLITPRRAISGFAATECTSEGNGVCRKASPGRKSLKHTTVHILPSGSHKGTAPISSTT